MQCELLPLCERATLPNFFSGHGNDTRNRDFLVYWREHGGPRFDGMRFIGFAVGNIRVHFSSFLFLKFIISLQLYTYLITWYYLCISILCLLNYYFLKKL
jgi:hypothetical protein